MTISDLRRWKDWWFRPQDDGSLDYNRFDKLVGYIFTIAVSAILIPVYLGLTLVPVSLLRWLWSLWVG